MVEICAELEPGAEVGGPDRDLPYRTSNLTFHHSFRKATCHSDLHFRGVPASAYRFTVPYF